MNDLFIIDNYVDEREFRNYLNELLKEKGYEKLSIDDVRLADQNRINDNDIIAKKGEIYYTVQVFLNKNITKRQIDETLADMAKENISAGIIVTNNYVSPEEKTYANEKLIQIWDRMELEKDISK